MYVREGCISVHADRNWAMPTTPTTRRGRLWACKGLEAKGYSCGIFYDPRNSLTASYYQGICHVTCRRAVFAPHHIRCHVRYLGGRARHRQYTAEYSAASAWWWNSLPGNIWLPIGSLRFCAFQVCWDPQAFEALYSVELGRRNGTYLTRHLRRHLRRFSFTRILPWVPQATDNRHAPAVAQEQE